MDVKKKIEQIEKNSAEIFKQIDDIALFNQEKVLNAFKKNKIADRHLKGSSGYGYDDIGRDSLNQIFADVFGCESGIASPKISSGTEALTIALFGLLRPHDVLLSISGQPYDTLMQVINGKDNGSLADFGIKYEVVELINNQFDIAQIVAKVNLLKPKVVYITRSRGYTDRDSLSIEQIGEVIKEVKSIYSDCFVVVDNCYGEFTDYKEPSEVGADLVVGSLIKNCGGGIAPTGGYLVGTSKAIELVSYRLTTPSLGLEVGSYISGYLPYYQGLFLAPSVVKNAMKGAVLWSNVFSEYGYATFPSPKTLPKDIISAITLNDKNKLIAFCQAIQSQSPIDSYVSPEPWAMPGYNDMVIMAAGTFIGGASIELSCDAPIKKPYIVYIQGGLTIEHIKLCIISSINSINSI